VGCIYASVWRPGDPDLQGFRISPSSGFSKRYHRPCGRRVSVPRHRPDLGLGLAHHADVEPRRRARSARSLADFSRLAFFLGARFQASSRGPPDQRAPSSSKAEIFPAPGQQVMPAGPFSGDHEREILHRPTCTEGIPWMCRFQLSGKTDPGSAWRPFRRPVCEEKFGGRVYCENGAAGIAKGGELRLGMSAQPRARVRATGAELPDVEPPAGSVPVPPGPDDRPLDFPQFPGP